MKSIRERFVNNHRKEVRFDPAKKTYRNVLVYTGNFYTWKPVNSDFGSVRKLFIVLELITVIVFGLSSIPGSVISYSPFVVSAALLSFAAWFFELYGMVSFCFRKLPLEEDDYAYIRKVFPVTFTVRGVFLLAAVILGIICMNEKGADTVSILSCIGYLITAIISVYLLIRYLKISKSVIIIPNTENTDNK